MEAPVLTENELSSAVISAALDVHRSFGPGLFESIYEEALVVELSLRGISVQRQKAVPVVYKGRQLTTPLKLDLLVEDVLIVECKSTEKYNAICQTQLLTYLRLSQLRLGLVINFGERLLKDGIHRVVNGL